MKKQYRNTAFLVELMINILVFCISCAILVALFGQAALYTRESRQQSTAAGELQNVVETLKAQPEDALGSNGFFLFYDKDWERTDDYGNAAYQIVVSLGRQTTGAGTLVQINASAHKCVEYTSGSYGPLIYSLSTAIYLPSEGGPNP